MNQLKINLKKVGEALGIFGIMFIVLPVLFFGGLFLLAKAYGNYWTGIIFTSTAVAVLVLHIAEQEPPKPKTAVYRVSPLPPKAAQVLGHTTPEPKSQEEKDKVLEVAEMQRDHWHKISMFLLGLVGILVTALGLLLRGAWPAR